MTEIGPPPPSTPTPTSEPAERRDPVSRAIISLVLLVVLAAAVLAMAAFLPRWWAQRIGNQVDGSMTTGIALGLFYGSVFLLLPLAVLRWAFRRRRSLKAVVWWIAVALVLAAPNLVTLAIVVGTGNAAHAGERILDVDAPGFRYSSAAGAAAAVVAMGAIEYLLRSRRRASRRAERLERELAAERRKPAAASPVPPHPAPDSPDDTDR
jgi:MFS family permease